MILPEIFRVVSRFPRYISCYAAENQLPLGQCMYIPASRFGQDIADLRTHLCGR